MAGLIGNNREGMADLANKFGHAVSQIQQVTTTLDGKATPVQWQGPDRFEHMDWPTYKTQRSKVAQNLQDVQQTVNRQKQDQTNTSAHCNAEREGPLHTAPATCPMPGPPLGQGVQRARRVSTPGPASSSQ